MNGVAEVGRGARKRRSPKVGYLLPGAKLIDVIVWPESANGRKSESRTDIEVDVGGRR
jgi:hypothetical protein